MGKNCIKQRRRRRPSASSTIAPRAPWYWRIHTRAGSSDDLLAQAVPPVPPPGGGRLAHACGPNPLTFPTHGLGRAGIYRLPMAQSAAAPPPPSAASDVESGLETTAPPPSCARAHGCAALLLPDMKLTAAGVPPEGISPGGLVHLENTWGVGFENMYLKRDEEALTTVHGAMSAYRTHLLELSRILG